MIGVLGPGAAFVAGVVSSTGPCMVPRLAALAGMTAGCRGATRATRVAVFAAGSCGGFALLGSFAGAVRAIAGYSPLAYAILAAAFTAMGTWALLRRPRGSACSHFSPGVPLGAVFLAGGAFAVAGSPCCGPVAAALLALSATSDSSWHGLAAAFAAGHIAPLVAAAAGLQRAAAALAVRVPDQAVATVGGAVAFGLAGYYALLA